MVEVAKIIDSIVGNALGKIMVAIFQTDEDWKSSG